MPQGDSARLALPVGEGDHVQGLATESVTLVEYGDYECRSRFGRAGGVGRRHRVTVILACATNLA
jgi:hypothetical protein